MNIDVTGGLPLVVGITGHRDPADPDLLLQKLAIEIDAIEQRWPSLQKVLLSAFADGADRIMVDLCRNRGWSIIAVLPMELERYREDFAEESRAYFDKLMEGRQKIPAYEYAGLMKHSSEEDLYRSAGVYIAEHSHILISAWNGEQRFASGGTADITRYRLERLPVRIDEETGTAIDTDLRLTAVVPTSRVSRAGPSEWRGGWCDRWNEACNGTGSERLSHRDVTTLDTMDEFNRKEITLHPLLSVRPEMAQEPYLEALFRIIDELATRRVTAMRRHWTGAFCLAMVAVLASAAYGDFYEALPYPWLVLAIYVSSLFLLVGLAIYDSRQSRRASSPNIRLLAETLRVLCAWQQAGVGRARPMLFYELFSHSAVPSWLAGSVRGLSTNWHQVDGEAYNAVNNSWIRPQTAYLNKQLHKRRWHQTSEKVASFGFVAGGIAAAGTLWLDIAGAQDQLSWNFAWLAAGALPAISGVALAYSQIMTSTGASRRARRLHQQFQKLNSLGNSGEKVREGEEWRHTFEREMIETGVEALSEVLSWYDHTRDAQKQARDLRTS